MNISDPTGMYSNDFAGERCTHFRPIYADKFCDEYKDVSDPRLQKLLLKQLDRFMEEEEARATYDASDTGFEDDQLDMKERDEDQVIGSLSESGAESSGDDDIKEKDVSLKSIQTPESKKNRLREEGNQLDFVAESIQNLVVTI